jgi:hypothetical protein
MERSFYFAGIHDPRFDFFFHYDPTISESLAMNTPRQCQLYRQ